MSSSRLIIKRLNKYHFLTNYHRSRLPTREIKGPRQYQMHNLNHVHVDEEIVETVLVISSLQSGKDLPDPYKNHPFHQATIDEEILVVAAMQESDSEDEEEQTKAEPNPDTYKPDVPYPQALNHPKAKVNESNNHLLEAFQKVTITIPLIDAIKQILAYAKFLKSICTPHRNLKSI